jgi:hypothetical protein
MQSGTDRSSEHKCRSPREGRIAVAPPPTQGLAAVAPPVAPLSAALVEALHRGDHADHQQADEQDQADVLDRPLAALGG